MTLTANELTKRSTMRRLTAQELPTLPELVEVPTYPRDDATKFIVHVGVGGFHRAHQAMYLDRLLEAQIDRDWGICGVGLLEKDSAMARALRPQDHLYTLVEKHPDGQLRARVIGSIIDFLHAPSEPDKVLDRLTEPATRIVSLTITEGGYNIDPQTGDFDPTSAAVQADLQPGATPTTVFGFIVEALRRRRTAGIPPFTVLSCDNVEGNGDLARRAVTTFARLRDDDLGRWTETEVAFPNAMVDRITPVTSDEDRHLVSELLGVHDAWPVVCEPFSQWVIEDDFPLGRPDWGSVDVQLVEDVRPYELMKLRLLNASHQALGYIGVLRGHEYVHEAAQDPQIARFVRAYMDQEATPTLDRRLDVDLEHYKDTVLARFANPYVRDTLSRICAETSDRIPKFLLPVVREQLRTGGQVRLSAVVIAAWARYAEGVDEQGHSIEVVDPMRDRIMAAAADREDPVSFLRISELFSDLASNERFTTEYVHAIESLRRHGSSVTLEGIARSEGIAEA